MAFLTILLLLFSFVFLGVGLSSSSTTDLIKPVVKCSQRVPPAKAPAAQGRHCGPPPANP